MFFFSLSTLPIERMDSTTVHRAASHADGESRGWQVKQTAGQAVVGAAQSDIEPEVHDVAFVDDVFLAFESQLPGLFRSGFPPTGYVVSE